MSHTCSTLVLHCIDFRLAKPTKEYLEQKSLLGDCDLVSIAGAAKNLIAPVNPSDSELVLRQIDIAQGLHGINRVIIMNHTDCGAYGGRKAFASQEEETAMHNQDMEKAADLLRGKFPNLTIETVLAHIDDMDNIVFL